MTKYYLKVTLLEREDGQELDEARPINAHTAVMGTDKEKSDKVFAVLSRNMGAMQDVFDLRD